MSHASPVRATRRAHRLRGRLPEGEVHQVGRSFSAASVSTNTRSLPSSTPPCQVWRFVQRASFSQLLPAVAGSNTCLQPCSLPHDPLVGLKCA
jgi:hypothetical protein